MAGTNLMYLKVNPETGKMAPYGFAWVWNTLLATWVMVENPDEPAP